MRLNRYDNNEALGIWDEAEQHIIIKREQLCRRDIYATTLLAEYILALSGADNRTIEFEEGLATALGTLADALLSTRSRENKKEQRIVLERPLNIR